MAFNIKSTLESLQSYLAASGYVRRHQIGDFKQAPLEDVSASIYMRSANVVSTTLNSTIELHVVVIRLHMNWLGEPTGDTELKLAEVVSNIAEDFLADFDLGATIRNIDVGGIYGTPLTAEWGRVDIGDKAFRVVELVVPLIVDDSASLAA